MSYLKFEVDGPVRGDLTGREVKLLQGTILHLAAMTQAVIVGTLVKGVMLNPPDEGKIGITLVFEEELPLDKENELKEKFVKKLNQLFKMSELALTAEVIQNDF